MEWLIESNNMIEPRSCINCPSDKIHCLTFSLCTTFCTLKVGGEECTSKSCLIYFT